MIYQLLDFQRNLSHDTLNWAPVSEPGFLHFSKMLRNFGILGEFLKMVSKNGSALVSNKEAFGAQKQALNI